MILLGHDEIVSDWVGKINGKPFIEVCKAIGIVNDDGRLTGGYVFTGYNGSSIEVSLAGKASITRGGWRVVTAYVFDQLKCSRLQVHTSMKNKRVRKIIGNSFPKGSFEGISHRFYGDSDAATYALTIDNLAAFRAKWRL